MVQYECQWLQIEAKGQNTPAHAGSTVVVREHRDGSKTLLLNGQKLRWHELAERPRKAPEIAKLSRLDNASYPGLTIRSMKA